MSSKENRTRASRALSFVAAVGVLLPALLGGSSYAEPSFGPVIRLPAGTQGTEPGVDLGTDGAVYVNAPTGLPSHSALWVAPPGSCFGLDAQGKTCKPFTQMSFNSPYNRLPGGGDSDVVIAPGLNPGDPDRVYFLDLWGGSNSISRSEDGGKTWVTGTPFTTLPLADRQWIARGKRNPTTGKDTIYVVYHQIVPPGALEFSRSDDGGETWTWHRIVPGLTPVAALPGSIVADGNFVAFNYVQSGSEWVAYSTDAGVNWTSKRVSFLKNVQFDSLHSIALDGDSLWATWVTNDYSIVVSHSPDRGVTWERMGLGATVSSNDGGETNAGSNIFPWVAARDGKVGVAWYGADDVFGDPNLANTAQWRVKYAELTGRDEFGNLTFSKPVNVSPVVKTGPICTQGVMCQGNRELGDFLMIEIDDEGKSMIVFTSAISGGVSFVRQI